MLQVLQHHALDAGVGQLCEPVDRLGGVTHYYIPANGSTWAAYWSPTDPNGEIVSAP